MSDLSLEENARIYADRNGIGLSRRLGGGMDGEVWESNRYTAVKGLCRQRNYIAELECYERFLANGVEKIKGFAVPRLIGHDDELQIVEIEIVAPPYIIDFAKCRLDVRFDFSPEVMADWDEAGAELFEGRWREVKLLLAALERYGIYYLDAKPGNITFDPVPTKQ